MGKNIEARYVIVHAWARGFTRSGVRWARVGVIVQVEGVVRCKFTTSKDAFGGLNLAVREDYFKNLTKMHKSMLRQLLRTYSAPPPTRETPRFSSADPRLLTHIYREWGDGFLYYGRPKKKPFVEWLSPEEITKLIYQIEIKDKLNKS